MYKTCTEDECENVRLARGYCSKHYQRWRRFGDPKTILPPHRLGSRKYALNESYFASIDSEDKAYWLGFVTADGGVIRSKSTNALRVELAAVDVEHLKKMTLALGSTKVASRRIKDGHESFCVSFDSWRLCDDLASLGVVPRKSLTAEPWQGPRHLMRHYWRGLIDGDGSIGRLTRDNCWWLSFIGSQACVEAFARWARSINGSQAAVRPVRGGVFVWSIQGTHSVAKLASSLYTGSTVSLNRKQDRVEKLLLTHPQQPI